MNDGRAGERPERAPERAPEDGAGDAPPRVKIGEYLAQQRRLRGISVDELCELTKIPRRNIERFESGAFDEQPDGFTRGFVRTVALAMGLDPDEAVMRLMSEPDADAEPAGGGARGLLLRWGAVAAAVLLAIVLFQLGSAWLTAAPPVPEEPDLTYRHDAVSDLARQRTGPDAAGAAEARDDEAEAGPDPGAAEVEPRPDSGPRAAP